MQRAQILAHRGWWTDPAAKNSPAALEAALAAGYGLETDFRDLGGALVISHDPPVGTPPAADWLFGRYAALGATGRIAMNVKADGLQRALAGALAAAGIAPGAAYAFDMAVPDALGYLAAGIPAYTRVSEYEAAPAFLDRAAGVWVDSFTGGFPQVETAARLMRAGHRAALVSPELHGRDPAPLWDAIAAAGLHENRLFELCTDLPQEAMEMFGTDA